MATISQIKGLEKLSIRIKKDILEMTYKAKVGHIGSSFSIAEILAVLFGNIMNMNPKNPQDPRRDRFILSKGHAGAAYYAALCELGFFPKKDLYSFCENNGIFGTHPVSDIKRGIELSTGSLGHGLSVGAGLAKGFKMNSGKQKAFVVISDAELNEGSIWEAVMFASHHKLNNLIAVVDDNSYQAFGRTDDVLKLHPIDQKFKSFGWETYSVNGHSIKELLDAFDLAKIDNEKPSIIIAKTITARGIESLEDSQNAHYLPLNHKQYKKALKKLKF